MNRLREKKRYVPLTAKGEPPTWRAWRRAVWNLLEALLSYRIHVRAGWKLDPRTAYWMFLDHVHCATCGRWFRRIDTPHVMWVDRETKELVGCCAECSAHKEKAVDSRNRPCGV